MFTRKNAILSLSMSLALAGCGGGSSEGTVADPVIVTSSTTSGKAIDGYLSAADVLCDQNNNGVADAAEATTTTDANGNFTFAAACKSTIVVSGGTNIDTGLPFKGVLKAPAGSTVATPLTSLLVSGLSLAEVAVALGLPVGTDVSKIDPAEKNGEGKLVNPGLAQKTIALQQIVQQITNTISGLAENSTGAALQAIGTEVAKALVTIIKTSAATPLIDNSGNVATTLVSSVIQQSVANVQVAADPRLAIVKTSIATISKESVAELTASTITAQAQTLAQTENSNTLTKSLQGDTTVADASVQLAVLLTIDNSAKVDMSAAGAALQTISSASTSGDAVALASAQTALTTTVAVVAKAAAVVVKVDLTALNVPSNYVTFGNYYDTSLLINTDSFRQGGGYFELTRTAKLIDIQGYEPETITVSPGTATRYVSVSGPGLDPSVELLPGEIWSKTTYDALYGYSMHIDKPTVFPIGLMSINMGLIGKPVPESRPAIYNPDDPIGSNFKQMTFGVGVEITDFAAPASGVAQLLQIVIDKVVLTDYESLPNWGNFKVAPASDAKDVLYARTSTAMTVNSTLTDTSDMLRSDASDRVTLDVDNIFRRLQASAGNAGTKSIFDSLLHLTKANQGDNKVFKLKMVFSSVDLRFPNGKPMEALSMQVTGSGLPPLTGSGLRFNFQLQDRQSQ